MEISFLDVLIAVAVLIVLAVPGFILKKTKILSEHAGEAISALVLYGCQPIHVFMSFQEYYDSRIAINMLIVLGLAFLLHGIMLGVVHLLIRGKSDQAKKRVARFACVFSNCGYMGIPFLQSIFPGLGEVIIYASVVIAVHNILNWTIGVYMITGNKKDMSVKKILLNPTIIATVIGAILFIAVGRPIASLATEGTNTALFLNKFMGSLGMLGNMITPLAMTVIGIRFANVNLKKIFLDKWAYVVCALKLILMAIITMLVVAWLPISETVKYVMFFVLAMPSATSTTLLTVRFGGDGDSASIYVVLTTVLSVITIPLMYLLFNAIC